MANTTIHVDPHAGDVQSFDAHPMPRTGVEAIEDEQGGIGPANHPDPTALWLDGTGWVSLAMAAFLLIIIWKGVPKLIGGLLDKQIAGIRARLDEAQALRADAEQLREEYLRKIATVEQETAAMVAHAEEEAKALIAQAEVDAAALVARRQQMAQDKIGAAERAAIAEVRAKAADAAAQAAAKIIAERHDASADQALVDRTIAGIARAH